MGTSIVGVGKPGVPAGDVVSVQGVAGGFPIPVTPTPTNPATTTVTSVAQSGVVVTLQAALATRKMLQIYNDPQANRRLFIKHGAGASLVDYTVSVPANGYYELPVCAGGGVYAGIVTGIWTAGGTGFAQVTETS